MSTNDIKTIRALAGVMLNLAAQDALRTGLSRACQPAGSCSPIGIACMSCLLNRAQDKFLDTCTRAGVNPVLELVYEARNTAETAGIEAGLHTDPPLSQTSAAEALMNLGTLFLLPFVIAGNPGIPMSGVLHQRASTVGVPAGSR